MSEHDDDRPANVDRRAFLTGAGKRSAAAATGSGGIFGWAIRRARDARLDDDEAYEDDTPKPPSAHDD